MLLVASELLLLLLWWLRQLGELDAELLEVVCVLALLALAIVFSWAIVMRPANLGLSLQLLLLLVVDWERCSGNEARRCVPPPPPVMRLPVAPAAVAAVPAAVSSMSAALLVGKCGRE